LEKKSLPRTSRRLGHRTSIHAIIFLWGYLKQIVYNQLLKTLEDPRSYFAREIENLPAQMFNLKTIFWIFEKGANYWFQLVAVILYKNYGHLYLTINGILFSLKWYITCEMVTYGCFIKDVLKMLIFKIHPVQLSIEDMIIMSWKY
jgi:hypothetical protein